LPGTAVTPLKAGFLFMKLRIAIPGDASKILAIYAPYIQNTSYTFETKVPSEEAFAERIKNYLINWPWLVCEIDGIITGYAYASGYREREAYQWSVESSVYVHDDFHRKGIAKALYSAQFEILKRQGFRNVYAVINLPNDKSVFFHENCGFEYFATYEKVGYKLGLWKNVGWWRRILNDFTKEPSDPLKFSEMDKTFLPGVLCSAGQMITEI
ncbi:MAG TPA: GNAT family N-acetyltransferase, partial [Chitinophagaceae bacterium]|nr:GNAT family N-acetyltransferase [Chitinophagaceae bacterium]